MTEKTRAETIITGHANADFDCFASIVAAHRLYPGAILVFPGSQEKNLRNFFIQSATYLFDFAAAKDLDFSAVKKLVVVDTRQRSRIEHVQDALDNPGLVVHIYDHHPDSEEDLEADKIVWKPWGSCTAIIAHELMEQDILVSPEEATIMALGIYEDTGSFMFASTTSHDLRATAWLRDLGMDLDVISDLITRELTAAQVSLLNNLLESAQTHDINGVEVVVAETTTDHYVGDFAVLVHKMMDMENVRVLFALGRMDDRVQLVARSKNPRVDVSLVCDYFGGGGHPYAGSASIKDRTLAQVKDELFAVLYSQIHQNSRVSDLMSRPVVSVEKSASIENAAEIMIRYGLKAMPVLEPGNGTCTGILEHDLADKAIAHGLGGVQVREYMAREIRTLPASASLQAVMEIILGLRQRLVPVVDEDGQVEGVVTRTDLINVLIEEPARIPEALYSHRQRQRNIGHLLRDRLPEQVLDLLRRAGELAQSMGHPVFAVGGFVRDILLGEENLDIDLVVEGEGIAFAQRLASELGGRVKSHSKFKTAVVILPDDMRIDVATARLEYYEYPAALPIVELSSLKMDLFRRDFTINALAVHLNPDRFGTLEDFFGSQRDIKDKTIRVLHSLSFVEDPTRILRAIRFEQRFGFKIGGHTERLIKNAVSMRFFQKLSGSRIFHELKLVFEEKNGLKCLQRMEELELLAQIHQELKVDSKRAKLLKELENVLGWYRLLYVDPPAKAWMLYFLGLTTGLDPDDVLAVVKRLSISKHEQRDFRTLRESVGQILQRIIAWSNKSGPLSELFFILEQLPLEGILYLMARSTKEDVKRQISMYLTRLRFESIDIGGDDLKEMGIEPGPEYGRIFRAVTAAKIDGLADCRSEQLSLARRLHEAPGEIPDPKT